MPINLSAKIHAHDVFFPAAAVYAALIVPLSVYALTSGKAWPVGLLGAGHGHEMIFGFVLALIAGYLLGSLSIKAILVIFLLWFFARIAWLFFPYSTVAAALSPLFALLLAWHTVPKFLAAKKWRNRSISPLLLILCLLPLVYAAMMRGLIPVHIWDMLTSGVILLALLMAFMGGRVIAPAAAGRFYQLGVNLETRVQPRLEGALILLIGVAAVLAFYPGTRDVAGFSLFCAGGVAAARLLRWRLWQCRPGMDLIGLGIGYAWLAAGLCLTGLALILDNQISTALHVITVGALGTLSINIMTRVGPRTGQRQTLRAMVRFSATALIALAVLMRIAAGISESAQVPFLWGSALCWSTAFLITAVWFPIRRQPGSTKP
ncbi:MAG: NnrS family protein [Gammaproteobacteria bacterium]